MPPDVWRIYRWPGNDLCVGNECCRKGGWLAAVAAEGRARCGPEEEEVQQGHPFAKLAGRRGREARARGPEGARRGRGWLTYYVKAICRG